MQDIIPTRRHTRGLSRSIRQHHTHLKMRSMPADLFNLSEPGNIYTRIMNPTTDVFEKRVASLEGGAAALAVSSGHAAQFIALSTIMRQGENLVTSPYLYGGTHNQFKVTFANFGLEARFSKDLEPGSFEKLIDKRQKPFI